MRIQKVTDDISIQRSVDNGTEEQRKIVLEILESVRREGDRALLAYTETFDGIKLDRMRVSEEEIHEAIQSFDPKLLKVLEEAAKNIRRFHEKQRRETWITQDEERDHSWSEVYTARFRWCIRPGGNSGLSVVCSHERAAS